MPRDEIFRIEPRDREIDFALRWNDRVFRLEYSLFYSDFSGIFARLDSFFPFCYFAVSTLGDSYVIRFGLLGWRYVCVSFLVLSLVRLLV